MEIVPLLVVKNFSNDATDLQHTQMNNMFAAYKPPDAA